MQRFFKPLALFFALMLTWQGAALGQITGAATAKDSIQHGVILHCFDWKYTDIQAELQNIKDAGFTAIQTSPVQKNYSGQDHLEHTLPPAQLIYHRPMQPRHEKPTARPLHRRPCLGLKNNR